MAIETSAEYFLYELSVMLDAERQSSRILLLLAGTTEDKRVQSLLREHEQETIQQVHNIEECFRIANAQPDSVVSEIVRGMKREIHAFMEHSRSDAMHAEFILDGLAKMEQFEISSYRVLIHRANS